MTMATSPFGPVTSPAMDIWLGSSSKHEFPPIEWALNPIDCFWVSQDNSASIASLWISCCGS